MNEFYKIVLMSSLTIIGSVLVYTIGQLVSKFFIDPIQNLAKCIENVSNALVFYANIYTNPGTGARDELDKIQLILREHASTLIARSNAIYWYRLFALLNIVPEKDNIEEASANLIGISNCIHSGDGVINAGRKDKISKALRFSIGN